MAKLKKSDDPQPLVISRLKVVAALQSCGNATVVNDLDYSKSVDLYSYDTAGKYTEWDKSVPTNPTKAFHLINTPQKEVVLLPLDNCIVKDAHLIEGGITDSAFDSSLVVTAASASFMNQMTQFQNEHEHPLFFTNEREL